jgi:NAD(P)H dehydrogenase (quinone)
MPNVAIVYYSAQGHTHALAQAVAEGAKGVSGTTVELLRLQDSEIQNGRWKNDDTIAKLNAADAIVFGTPTYMGGYSAQMKCFIDACGGIWYQQGWKDKVGAGFSHSQGLSGDKLNTLNGLYINAMQHGMIWVGLGITPAGDTPDKLNRISSYSGLMAQSSYGQAEIGAGDKATAEVLGKRVAETVARWTKGK